MADLSAIPQNQLLGRLAGFLRFLEKDRPEFLPSELGAMQAASKLMLPQASTVENLSYGNLPFTMPPSGTGAMIPQVKTGRKAEVADLVGMITGGVPGAKTVADVGTKLSNEAADALVRMITRNPQATAPAVLQETSMPFMNAIAPRQPGLLSPQKSELGFYSALEQATMPLQNKGTGAQFLAQIEKTPGVKPEELKWTGLDEFLRSRQNVTKAEVRDYLNANRVNLQEVRLGDPSPEDVRLFMQDEAGQNYDYADALEFLRGSEEAPKFSSYTLPGGENYREILLTLPRKTVEAQPMDISGFSVRTTENAMFPYTGQRDIEVLDSAGNVVSRRSGFRGTDEEAIQNYAGTVTTQAQKADESLLNYRSSHFEQPNILAHMRVNDRVVDGKKTLFIEEIQSDWHQAGRKKGYDTPEARATEQQKLDNILAERQALLDEQLRLEKLAEPYTSQGRDAPREIVDQWSIVSNRLNNLQTEQNRLGRGFGQQVPDAPFKTSWHELTLKRAIQEASEKGYDQIAFTTGKTQAERYDLSKQVKSVEWNPYQERGAERLVTIYPKDGNSIELPITKDGLVSSNAGTQFDGKPIDEVIGKDIAKQIMEQRSGELSGQGLSIGGEGMKGFYDNILPKSLEKLGKKFDAKVGKTEMDGVEVWQMDITPKMRESVLTKGQPLFAATPVLPAGLLGRDEEE